MSRSGWGDTGAEETSTDKLQEALVPIVESSNCLDSEGVDENLIVCTSSATKGPCKVSQTKYIQCYTLRLPQGDSGGPLTVVNEEGTHTLVGIVSKRLGESCSQQDFAVFTSVSAFLPWIESSIKENGGMASCSFNFSALPTLGISKLG